MPRIISDEEKELTKQALQQASVALIKSKGLRHVTVSDITNATGMAKGSFYFHYQTKEELLYEVIEISVSRMFDIIMNFQFDAENIKGSIEKVLFDIYLAPDSVALYLKPTDLEHLWRKSSAEIRERVNAGSLRRLKHVGEFFGLSEEDRGTLSYLMDALWMLASYEEDYGSVSRRQSLEILVRAIAEFLSEKSVKK